jgi:hypothetical protein
VAFLHWQTTHHWLCTFQDEILRDQQRELQRIQAQQQKTATIEPSTPDNTTTAPSGVTPLFASTNAFEDHRLTTAPAALAPTPMPGAAPVSNHGVSAAAAVMRLAEQNEARLQALSNTLVRRLHRAAPAPLQPVTPRASCALVHRAGCLFRTPREASSACSDSRCASQVAVLVGGDSS